MHHDAGNSNQVTTGIGEMREIVVVHYNWCQHGDRTAI